MRGPVSALGYLPLMLARRASRTLASAGIGAEVFRDDAILARAHSEYAGQAGLAYLRVASFDPEAFGVLVPIGRVEEAREILSRAGMQVAALEVPGPGEGDLPGPFQVVPAGEPDAHPYRGSPEERVCLRCGEPEMPARPPGAPCGRCGGKLGRPDAWEARRRRATRIWAALVVLGLVGLGLGSSRLATCSSSVHVER